MVTTLSNKYGEVYDRSEIEKLSVRYAKQYGVDPHKMVETIECETDFSNVQSDITQNGVREDSWGIAQINLRWHPNVTKQQALTPEFAVEFMAKMFSQGKAERWTCFRSLYN